MNNYVTCPCQYCDKGIEFDSGLFQSAQTVSCPHCGLDTILFISYKEPEKIREPKPIKIRAPLSIKTTIWIIVGGGVFLFGLAGGFWAAPSNGFWGFVVGFFCAIFGLAILPLLFLIYFLPYVCARKKKKKNCEAIGILNIFFGWTFVGWVIALVWASMED